MNEIKITWFFYGMFSTIIAVVIGALLAFWLFRRMEKKEPKDSWGLKPNKYLTLVLLLFLSVTVFSQPPEEKKLILDETWIQASGKNSFRIITSNDQISSKILVGLTDSISRITTMPKKDRMGKYWEKTYYFKNTSWNYVLAFIKKL